MKKIPEIILLAVLVASILGFVSPKENITPMENSLETSKEKAIEGIKIEENNLEINSPTENLSRRERMKASFEKLDRYCHL